MLVSRDPSVELPWSGGDPVPTPKDGGRRRDATVGRHNLHGAYAMHSAEQGRHFLVFHLLALKGKAKNTTQM